MRFIISCLSTNELILFNEDTQSIEKTLRIEGMNKFDILHSVRALEDKYLISTTYGVHFVEPNLSRIIASFSLERLSNVHSVDLIEENYFVIANTGYDELIFCRLDERKQSLIIERLFDSASYIGKPKKLEYKDRRAFLRVSASDDWTHINCAYPGLFQNRLVLFCCLFHTGDIILVDPIKNEVAQKYSKTGIQTHSSYPIGNEIYVCSSQESMIKIFAKESGVQTWEYLAPYSPWTRSAKPLGNQIIFTAEKDRTNNFPSSGYIAKIDKLSKELIWLFKMDEQAPFDIEVAIQ
ncbi:hypothetical protein [Microcoleus sp. herbarium14]|uniref:hypothetical protein n=1 Tax=Microcoleus sp. herbarium14 TaxID=3055439 RepID=UPI002FD644E7